MARQLIINASPQEARVALIDEGRLLEVFIERAHERGIAGNVYKGRVTRVLPGMQAAFVDIGLEKAAFLRAADFFPKTGHELVLVDEEEDVEPLPTTVPPIATSVAAPATETKPAPAPRPAIETLLKKGQEILVQVVNGPIGTKGARVTSHLAIPGRHLVFMPLTDHIGVSRRIESPEERQRLKALVEELRPAGAGFIIRTACEGLSKREIQSDIRFLSRLWSRILKKRDTNSAPCLLHYDMDLILRSVRDLFTTDVERVVIDSNKDFSRVIEFLETVMPRFVERVEHHTGPTPLFDRFGLEPQIAKALDRRVALKSGGYIVIDQTEALTAIDVNTGRYVGKTTQEDTVLRTNLEATAVIVDQLRLRNVGGLIIIDFIDMEKAVNRKKVHDALTEAVRRDKARTNILHISELGLVEMTRKRRRESLQQALCEPCPTCDGRGVVRSVETVAYEILRRLRREAATNPKLERLAVRVAPAIADFLTRTEAAALSSLEDEFALKVVIKPATDLADQLYDVTAVEKAA